MNAVLVQDRIARIARRWPRWRWTPAGEARWERWDEIHYLGGIAAGCFLASSLLDFPVWDRSQPLVPDDISAFLLKTSSGQTLLILFILFNGWVLSRYVSDKTPKDRYLPVWIKSIRFALLSIPLLGIAAIPAWKALLSSGILSKLFRTTTISAPTFESQGVRSGRALQLASFLTAWRHRLAQSSIGLAAWVVPCQTLPALSGIYWIGSGAAESPGRHAVLVLAWLSFHLLASLLAFRIRPRLARRFQWSGLRLALSWAVLVSLLLPFPLSLSGALLFSVSGQPEEPTLAYAVHVRRPSAARLPLGWRLLRSRTQRLGNLAIELGQEEMRRPHARSLLLPVEGAGIFDRRRPRWARIAFAALAVSAVFPLGGLAIPGWIFMRHRIASAKALPS